MLCAGLFGVFWREEGEGLGGGGFFGTLRKYQLESCSHGRHTLILPGCKSNRCNRIGTVAGMWVMGESLSFLIID